MEVLSILLNPFAWLECPRLVIEAPHVQALPEVDNLVIMGDFLLALRELNLLQL
jgi:hypothetical protein